MRRMTGSWLDISDPPWLRVGKRGSTAFLVIGCILISTWQLSYAGDPGSIDRTYQRSPGMRGIYGTQLQRFFYFFHFTGAFPITMRAQSDVFRDDEFAARRLLEIRNPYLMNE